MNKFTLCIIIMHVLIREHNHQMFPIRKGVMTLQLKSRNILLIMSACQLKGSWLLKGSSLCLSLALLPLLKKCCCGHDVQLKTSTRGTLLVVSDSCPNGHKLHWESQPLLNSMAVGNLLISTAILFCGLTYTRVANMANVLHMPILSERSSHRLQRNIYSL